MGELVVVVAVAVVDKDGRRKGAAGEREWSGSRSQASTAVVGTAAAVGGEAREAGIGMLLAAATARESSHRPEDGEVTAVVLFAAVVVAGERAWTGCKRVEAGAVACRSPREALEQQLERKKRAGTGLGLGAAGSSAVSPASASASVV